jgi:two-component system LytT family sensor kinase
MILRSYQAKRRANNLLALRSLRAQMNPHFIFNSLNSINSFISKNDERSANKYLANFSRLMRTVLEHSSHDFVPLEAEIRVLELYLKLEHVRFSDQFSYTFEVDPQIDPQAVEVPPMLIQPYIENAIWHGLRYKKQPGHLRVMLRREGDQLLGVVEDDGIGRARSMEAKTKNQKTHQSTGLKNTAQRIQLIHSLYGKEVSVEISDLHLEADDCGTQVRLLIPFHKLT